MAEELYNWANSLRYQAQFIHRPSSILEAQALVASARSVRALGSRHSFSRIADTTGELISTELLQGIDDLGSSVVILPGVTYGHLCPWLAQRGLAVPNLASLPHISVAGACATGTHGSGDRNRILADAATGVDIVTANGSIRHFDRSDPNFWGAAVGLGALGVVVRLTIQPVPAFNLKQEVFEGLRISEFVREIDPIMASGYSVSLFTRWQGEIEQIWVKRLASDNETLPFNAAPADSERHPIRHISPVNCTPQLGAVGPSHERLPHFRFEYTPSSGSELQSEFLVPRDRASEAVETLARLGDRISPNLHISEIRSVAADSFWMSPAFERDSIAIHFTWKKNWNAVRKLLPVVEAALEPFDARPHWGKLFTMDPSHLRSLYPKLDAFRELVYECDPAGKFRNDFLDQNLGLYDR